MPRWTETYCTPRAVEPILYRNWPEQPTASFAFTQDRMPPPSVEAVGFGKLYYLNGWTGLILWNRQVVFIDRIVTFSEMIGLLSDSSIERAFDELV